MNRNLEMIVTNRDSAIRQQEEFQRAKQSFIDVGFNIAQVEAMEREKNNEFEEANNAFWEAFKFPLTIRDVQNEEKPKNGDKVYVFDDYHKVWQRMTFFDNGHLRYFIENIQENIKCDPERYHFWIELPTVFEGSY